MTQPARRVNLVSERPDLRVARTLWQWLSLGLLAVLLLPEARGASHWLGNAPFWLVLAPALALVTLYRHARAVAWRARLVRATPRRRRRSQAALAPGLWNRSPGASSRRASPVAGSGWKSAL